MSGIRPWAKGPFELLLHAEGHLRNGDDFDRRIALISFDNAIEVAITTYLSLTPIQRGNRQYQRAQVEQWLNNYHTKLDFLECECTNRTLDLGIDRASVIWAHDHRNEQYHGGNKGTPEIEVLRIIRESALWIFGFLFDVYSPEEELEREMLARRPATPPERERRFDVAIDGKYGMIEVCEEEYYASELLFSVDPVAYRVLGARLLAGDSEESGELG
jgi:hypothetical protein